MNEGIFPVKFWLTLITKSYHIFSTKGEFRDDITLLQTLNEVSLVFYTNKYKEPFFGQALWKQYNLWK